MIIIIGYYLILSGVVIGSNNDMIIIIRYYLILSGVVIESNKKSNLPVLG
jgi:hypothetical protein